MKKSRTAPQVVTAHFILFFHGWTNKDLEAGAEECKRLVQKQFKAKYEVRSITTTPGSYFAGVELWQQP